MTTPAVDGGLQGQLAQIQIELGRQSTQLAVIDTKLDGLITSRDDHESRLRGLEQFKWKVTGMALAAGLGSSALGTWVGYLVSRH